MASEATYQKAYNYLLDGKVKIWLHTPTEAIVHVYGSKLQPYFVTFSEVKGWECNCPAQTECAHLIAVKIISPLTQPKTLNLGNDDK